MGYDLPYIQWFCGGVHTTQNFKKYSSWNGQFHAISRTLCPPWASEFWGDTSLKFKSQVKFAFFFFAFYLQMGYDLPYVHKLPRFLRRCCGEVAEAQIQEHWQSGGWWRKRVTAQVTALSSFFESEASKAAQESSGPIRSWSAAAISLTRDALPPWALGLPQNFEG